LLQVRRGISVAWTTRENGVTYQPALTIEFQAYAAGRMTGQVMYAYTTAAEAHDLAVTQLKVGWHGQQPGVGIMHANGRARGLTHFGQRGAVIGMAVREQYGREARARDGTQQRAGVRPWIHEQRTCLATEEDITVGLVLAYWQAKNVHLMGLL